jgi:hypothetical protein
MRFESGICRFFPGDETKFRKNQVDYFRRASNIGRGSRVEAESCLLRKKFQNSIEIIDFLEAIQFDDFSRRESRTEVIVSCDSHLMANCRFD